ncbi:unnamed protein product [Caenorhabditis bovis]|uniref:E3 ubiquitin-protein ligase n=1 Tax=Caenorhabditis bovis TaxID=2654633 RepID=A0A8S1EZ81_9PELO|nr:unnamed protein product [Caenorhabditis bovis]
MEGIDPDVLLEWLQTGIGEERDLQLMALEQLCMLLLMADNIDRCFESCPPRTFIPALCKIFLDETAPDSVLEVTARAITYYLDVSNECTRRIIQVEGAVKAICTRLAAAEMSERSSKDLAEQCVKLLEHVCQRETMAVYEAGAINVMLNLVRQHGGHVHRDTIYSAMSVVTRLCGKMEPNDSELAKCAESLDALLENDDAKVSESALRCFAALTDRFIRKNMDPAELATHSNLVEHLLGTLASSNDENSNVSTNFLSIVLSLLSNLCRGSTMITEKVLSSPNMIKGLSAVLTNKEERVVTDGLRLADLLLVLLCEGRSALPTVLGVSGDYPSGGTERTHRHLIDAIRQKDTNALYEAIESGQVDVNYTDDVGQSLCNWASAFGTIEMVQYLCDKGVDVNKGHKSSSLHYAACFGRPDIVKLLLQRGANPDLRDEDGKTALDKARERSDEDHSQVAVILESPTVYMHSKTDDGKTKKDQASTNQGASSSSSKAELPDPVLVKRVLHQLLPIFCDIFQRSLNASVRRTSLSLMRKIVENIGDLRQPSVDKDSMDTNARKMSTGVVCAAAESLMAVVVSVLDQEDDHEGQEQVLMIIATLLEKDPELWVTELIRLGVFERVEAMAKEPPKGLEQVLSEVEASSKGKITTSTSTIAMETDQPTIPTDENDIDMGLATQTPPPTVEIGESTPSASRTTQSAAATASSAILQVVSKLSGSVVSSEKSEKKAKIPLAPNTAYRWKEWRIMRGASSVFIWSDVLLIELPFQSNGWFRYLADNDSHMQFVSGMATVDQTEEEKNNERKAMVLRWKMVKDAYEEDMSAVPISVLGIPSSSKKVSQKLEVPGWELWSTRSSELIFRSTTSSTPDGQQNNMTTTIKDDSGGFIFDSSNGRKVNVMPEMPLPSDFHTGWSSHGLSARKLKFRVEIQQRKVQELAWKLWNEHLKEAHAKPREALVRLEKAAVTIENAVRTAKAMRVSKHKNVKQPRIERVQDLVSAMRVVHESIVDDRRLSTFEFSVSGIVPALYNLLSLIEIHPESYPASIFRETFSSGDALSQLAQKMVSVLEANEKFPQHLYDTPGGSALGLQLLGKRVRTKLELFKPDGKENDGVLADKTGKLVKVEPLATTNDITQFILKMVAKQWHDRERSGFRFVRIIQDAKSRNEPLKFSYTSDFDEQGIIYWLGTNGGTVSEWTNPATINVVKVTCSDSRQPFGKPEDILSRDDQPINCHTSDDKNSHFTIDLGVHVIPTAYSLRHARGYGRSALRSWMIQGSKDKTVWELIHAHKDDQSLGEPGSTATWHFADENRPAYRYIRLSQNGKNASGHTYYISLSGFEIYGEIVDVVLEPLSPPGEKKEPTPSSSSSQAPSTSNAGVASANVCDILPAGEQNNKFKFGITVDAISTFLNKSKSRGNRNTSKGNETRGVRVVRGKNWMWEDQDGGNGKMGRIVNGPDNGWVDVLWDNGYCNSYRYGINGQFDVERAPSSSIVPSGSGTSSSNATSVMDSVRTRSRGLLPKTRSDGRYYAFTAVASGATSGTLSSIASGLGFGLNRKKLTATSTASTPLSRFASSRNTQASQGSNSGSTASSSIGKKSMSTTNLVDDRQKTSGPSVASTGQAASAESLQHQTPSLENLLARAMPHAFGRIAENQEPEEGNEDEPMGGEESDSATSMQSAASSHSQMSMSSMNSSVPPQSETVTPRDTTGTPPTPRDEKANNLSVSAPDLAAARQRQQSAETQDKAAAMEEEEEDEETLDEEEEDEDEEEAEESGNEKDEKDYNESERGHSGMFDKIKDMLVGESSSNQSTSSGNARTSSGKKSKLTTSVFKQKMSDLFRGKLSLFEQAAVSMDMDDFMDDDDYYDYSEEGNEEPEELELELASHLGVSAQALQDILSGRAPQGAWKQLTRLMLGTAGSGNRDRANRGGGMGGARAGSHWEDELVVKCNFHSLIPAFDPRPGRSNVNQTLEVELPAVVSNNFGKKRHLFEQYDQQVKLYLRGPNMSGVENVTIEMKDEDASIFKYMQYINNTVNWATKSDKSRRIWEPCYTILYADASENVPVEVTKIASEEETVPLQVNQCLEVIGLLSKIQEMLPEASITPSVFISDKLTMKLTQVLCDALVVATRSLPEWCSKLVYKYPCLFSVETRNMYMQATAFGVTRTVVWLQQRRDAALERTRGSNQTSGSSATRQHDRYHEYRVGRLRHERVKITRSEELILDQAVRLMKFHAERKSVLEIEYANEEGTGLGPTLEFYALVAAELQRKALAIWVCDDDDQQPKAEERELDLGEGKKPAGYYVRRNGGLFPAPLPPHTEEVKRAAEMFRVLGIFLAKVLQDGRLVDLPLSRPFLKLLVHPQVSELQETNLRKVLTLDDFEEVNPVKGNFLKELRALAQRKRAIENEPNLDQLAKRRKIGELKLQMKGTTCRVEDLALSFTVNPPSKVFKYEEMELVEGGADIDVTMDNVEQYVEKCEDFYLNTGIVHQMRAFREGFDRVFPLRALRAYSPEEVQRLLSGEQCPEWTREDVINFTEPKLGYTRESPGFLRFVDVMVALSAQERKNFLQFATGCSSLPPGGLANLHPRLTIVRKVESGDGSYPSVNTCVHYLKLPEYSSAEILRERLLTAMSIPAVVREVTFVGEQLFDHSAQVRAEIDRFVERFERNERHREFDGLLRASHALVEASETPVEGLFDIGKMEMMKNDVDEIANKLVALTTPRYGDVHENYLAQVRKEQKAYIDACREQAMIKMRNLSVNR